MAERLIKVGDVAIANDRPMVLFGGLNVLESRDLALEVAGRFRRVAEALDVPFVFKASFDKANRSSARSKRGPGLERGLRWLEEVKRRFGVPVMTDVHLPEQAAPAAEVADILQLPAFLSRQTDLVAAMAATGAAINIKKAQYLAPGEMRHILEKFGAGGARRLMLCERGTSFGYRNLVVDMLGFAAMKDFGCPVLFDVTHALQLPGGRAEGAGGRRARLAELARAGVSQGLAGLFVEAHPEPDAAWCDGPCALRLERLEPFVEQLRDLDRLVKSFPPLDTA